MAPARYYSRMRRRRGWGHRCASRMVSVARAVWCVLPLIPAPASAWVAPVGSPGGHRPPPLMTMMMMMMMPINPTTVFISLPTHMGRLEESIMMMRRCAHARTHTHTHTLSSLYISLLTACAACHHTTAVADDDATTTIMMVMVVRVLHPPPRSRHHRRPCVCVSDINEKMMVMMMGGGGGGREVLIIPAARRGMNDGRWLGRWW